MSTSGTPQDNPQEPQAPEEPSSSNAALDLFLREGGDIPPQEPPPSLSEDDADYADEVQRLIPQLAAAVEVLAPKATPRHDGRKGNNNFPVRTSNNIAKSILYRAQLESGERLPNGRVRLTKLTGPHLMCITLHLTGITYIEIGLALGRSVNWCCGVIGDPLARAEIKRRSVLMDAEFAALHSDVVAAVRTGLNDENPDVKLRASHQWLKATGRFTKAPESDNFTAEDIVKGVLDQQRNGSLAAVALSTNETHVHVHIDGKAGGLTKATEIFEGAPDA